MIPTIWDQGILKNHACYGTFIIILRPQKQISSTSLTKRGPVCAILTNSQCLNILTHWGWVTHICVGKLTIIGSDNGLSPGRRQAIIWTNAGILLNEPLGTSLSEILIGIQIFSFKKMRLKMSSAKWRPFCLGLNVLTRIHHTVPMWSIAACPNSLVMEIRHVFNCTRHARTEAKPTPLTKWVSFLQDRELQR